MTVPNEAHEPQFSTATTGEQLPYYNGFSNFATWAICNQLENNEQPWTRVTGQARRLREAHPAASRETLHGLLGRKLAAFTVPFYIQVEREELRDWARAWGHNLAWAKAQINYDEIADVIFDGVDDGA